MVLIGDALRVTCLSLQRNPRRVIKMHIADLIVGWGHCGTNRRHAKGRASLIVKNFKTRFNLACHRFDCRLGATVALIENAPVRCACVSYLMPPMGILVVGCFLELARIWQRYCICIKYMHIQITYKNI
jgi:hypothetical protein